MRYLNAIAITALLCTACSTSKPCDQKKPDWFTTYQTDRTCQQNRPPVDVDDIDSPTSRAQPF